MKKLFATACTFFLLTTAGQAVAQNYGKLIESVDKEKAADSVDTEKLQGAYKEGEVDYKEAYDAIDKDKAKDSVDMEKAKEALWDK